MPVRSGCQFVQAAGPPPAPVKSKKNINIVLFGEGGAGKSSVIRLVAGDAVPEPSRDARGSTLNSQRYTFKLEGNGFTIWDTVGLGESVLGVANPPNVNEKMRALIQLIQKQGGLDLLLFCIPGAGSRITQTTISNYRLFFEGLCEERVPIAVVVTHLEDEVDEMRKWWDRNKEYLDQCGLKFSGHACVTGLLDHSKTEEGKAALESLLLGFDHAGRYTMPPISDHFSRTSEQSSAKDDHHKPKQPEHLAPDRIVRDSDNGFIGNLFKNIFGSAFQPQGDDIVVFVVGPSASGKSTFVRAVARAFTNGGDSRPCGKKIQAIRCELPQKARTTLNAEERKNIVLVDTPSFHTDLEGDAKAMNAWFKESKSKSTLVGTIYVHRIEEGSTQDSLQRHLDAFAGTFPPDFIARAFPMRLHCVFSRPAETTETDITRHREKIQEQVGALRPNVVNGWKPRWETSIHDDLLVGEDPEVARKAVEILFSSPGRW